MGTLMGLVQGVISQTTPAPNKPQEAVVPYRLPLASNITLLIGYPPSLHVKSCSEVYVQGGVGVGVNLKTVP